MGYEKQHLRNLPTNNVDRVVFANNNHVQPFSHLPGWLELLQKKETVYYDGSEWYLCLYTGILGFEPGDELRLRYMFDNPDGSVQVQFNYSVGGVVGVHSTRVAR